MEFWSRFCTAVADIPITEAIKPSERSWGKVMILPLQVERARKRSPTAVETRSWLISDILDSFIGSCFCSLWISLRVTLNHLATSGYNNSIFIRLIMHLFIKFGKWFLQYTTRFSCVLSNKFSTRIENRESSTICAHKIVKLFFPLFSLLLNKEKILEIKNGNYFL